MHPPGNSYRSDVEPVPLLGDNHKTYQSSYTEIYAIKCKSNFFSIFVLRTIDANDFFGTKYVIIDESSFLFETSTEKAKCKKRLQCLYLQNNAHVLWNNSCSFSQDLVRGTRWTSPPFCKFFPVINAVTRLMDHNGFEWQTRHFPATIKINWITPAWCIAWRGCANVPLCHTTCFAGSTSWNQN